MLSVRMFCFLASTWMHMASCIPALDRHSTIRGVQIVFRHGRRTPFSSFVNDSNKVFWNDNFGQLTMEGRKDAYGLGSWFRQNYGKFISDRPNDNDIYIESTNYTRTLTSAQLFISGVYGLNPEEVWNNTSGNQWQDYPIHVLLQFKDESPCPRYNQLQGIVNQTPESLRTFEEYEALIKKLLRGLGKSENSTGYFAALDIIMATIAHNKTVPEWLAADMPKVNNLLQYLSSMDVKIPELTKFNCGQLLKRIMCRFNDIKNAKSLEKHKVFAYSGHDVTVMPLLDAFGVFSRVWPPFSAAVILELHEKDDNEYLRVLYRNNSNLLPYVLNMPSCGQYCPWEHFWNYVRKYFLDNRTEECKALLPDELALKKEEINERFL